MTTPFVRNLRRWNIATHRDLGYFFSSLIIIYCLSGIALNHINDWNPDFIIEKRKISVDKTFAQRSLSPDVVHELGALVGERSYKVYDVPTPDRVKIYFDNASMLVDFSNGTAEYEKVSRRPVFYQSNVLHRNSVRGWKWASDVFAVMLIVISVTGLFILKGKNGLGGRGKWWILAGALPPLLVLLISGFM